VIDRGGFRPKDDQGPKPIAAKGSIDAIPLAELGATRDVCKQAIGNREKGPLAARNTTGEVLKRGNSTRRNPH
jgi:hypothetical protein